MKLAWCDVIALAIYAMVMAFWLFLSLIANNGHPPADGLWFAALWSIAKAMFLWVALPIWIVLRIIDLMIAGPSRRRGQIIGRW